MSLHQEDVLVTISDQKISVGEFLYSFNKSFQNNSDSITVDDVNDYLRLFVNYKLKVAEARSAGYDTLSEYKSELAHYQEQVKSSYRVTEKIIDDLSREAYERMKYEVNVSHILLRLDENASPKDTLEAYYKLMELRSSEEDFSELAIQFSEDPSAKVNKGDLGYFSVFKMVYPFESAAYSTEVGEISMPLRTQFGYHLLKVMDKRPVVNLMVHQIYIPKSTEGSGDIIFQIHEMLSNGMEPQQLMETELAGKNNVEHRELNPTGVNQLNQQIRGTLENLERRGDLTDPIEDEGFWNIYVLKERMEIPPFANIEKQLNRMVRSTDRLNIYQQQFVDHLLKKYEYQQVTPLSKIIDSIGSETVLMTISGKEYLVSDFMNFLKDKKWDNKQQLSTFHQDYLKDIVFKLEDQNLLDNNPDLKWLLKEYEEGMLLFSIMEDSIWDKAAKDTVGLTNFAKEYTTRSSLNEESKKSEQKGRVIAAYQEFLEEQWVEVLRNKYTVNVNQKVLEKVYEELVD